MRRVGSGPLLLVLLGAGLAGAGVLALFLALTGRFLPHDLGYLGMSDRELCAVDDCRVVGFMVHDRAAFGGALIAVGVLYGYLALVPLRRGEAWAWWLFLVSGGAGFLSFLSYLAYGYLDTWHAAGTALLLPLFAVGLIRSRHLVDLRIGSVPPVTERLPNLTTRAGLGRAVLLAGAGGVALAGLEILRIGVTGVFVTTDLAFLGTHSEHLHAVSPRLIPLIAHDRAGFGAAVFITGLTTFGLLWHTTISRAAWRILWWAVLAAGTASLTAAIGIHFLVGYVDLWHLAPAAAGAASLVVGLALSCPTGRGVRLSAP